MAPSPGLTPRASSPTRWVIVGAVGVIVGALLVLWWMSRAQPETASPPPTNATDVAVGSNRPRPQPMELPALDASDTTFRDMVAALSHHPLLARLLATDELVRNAVLAVEQIGEGRTPANPLRVLRPASRLTILGTDSGRIDPASYARWDSATTSLTSIDPKDAAQLYVNVKPLFDDAYRGLGHPNGDFDTSIVTAINMLSATPEIDGDPELLRRPAYFEHVDPALRSIRPVQKEMLLVGPGNRHRIMNWLKGLALALDLKID